MDDTIKTVLSSWIDRKLPPIIPRELPLESYLNTRPRKIIVITGFRRVGKTYALLQLLTTLLKKNTRQQEIYINFDDERIPRQTEFLTHLIPKITQTFHQDIRHLFLDELQNMPSWSNWLRRIYDTEECGLFVTGSSSKMSSNEIPTELRGRSLELKLFPLSFREFLRFTNTTIDTTILSYSERQQTELMNKFESYLKLGAMPEVVLADEDKKKEILQQYFGTVVQRDIIERNHVNNEEGMKAMLRLLLNSTQYSISRLYDTLKSAHYEIGKTTLLHYLSYVESSYFIHSVPIFSYKIKDQLQYPRKVYFIDNGFITSLSTRHSQNMGRLYENLTAIELLRRQKLGNTAIYYWKDRRGNEVDFLIKDELTVKQLIQVCYDIDDYDTRKRELNALVKASKEVHCNNLLVLTQEYEQKEKIKDKTVTFIPLYKWLFSIQNHR